MNHLAHCFLSFDNEDLLLGNFIGDYVKGNDWKMLPHPVQQGVRLHRTIDSFTDAHASSDKSVARIRAFSGRYSPPMVDVLYDHILSLHWDRYSDEPFEQFAQKAYLRLEKRAAEMPEALQERLPRMLAGKFLHGYATREGMEFVMGKFSQRLPANVDVWGVLQYFFEHLPDFEADFDGFFPDLLTEAKRFVQSNP